MKVIILAIRNLPAYHQNFNSLGRTRTERKWWMSSYLHLHLPDKKYFWSMVEIVCFSIDGTSFYGTGLKPQLCALLYLSNIPSSKSPPLLPSTIIPLQFHVPSENSSKFLHFIFLHPLYVFEINHFVFWNKTEELVLLVEAVEVLVEAVEVF